METSRQNQLKWTVAALLGAGLILAFASWFDTSFMTGVMREAGSDFNPAPAAWAQGLGFLAIVTAILVLAYLVRQAHSALVAGSYLVVGLFFAFLSVIIWTWAASINGAPPLLPGPIADFLGQLYQYVVGPLNAVPLIGAGMALVGALALVQDAHERTTRGSIAESAGGSGGGSNAPA